MIDDPNDEGLQEFAVEVIEEMLAGWTLEDRMCRRLDPNAVAEEMLRRADKHGPISLSDFVDARLVARDAAALVIARSYQPVR